ncbi:TPA: hypothetical protein N0F65_005698 [Lagenidium giganteum]|uniref:DDE-1 domain-containing protein n=1 Tax=Lagenidium giganteum TaxID=4803 RepID=A0AAV2Z8Q8_9STRA|nr:TPA: hypothetical protein N0F65_005698 [Lagenidium giganteum]
MFNVYNADQTAVFFEMLPKKTIDRRGQQTVCVTCGSKEKERATAMVVADWCGKPWDLFLGFKVKPSSVAATQEWNVARQHGFRRGIWSALQPRQAKYNTRLYGNLAGWWNADLTVTFLRHHFVMRDPTSPPVLLLLDAFSGHLTYSVRKCAATLNVHLMQVPSNLTWRAQPADVAWMTPVKDRLRQLKARGSTPSWKLRPPSRADIVGWVEDAWHGLSQTTLVNGFRKCGFVSEAVVEEEPACATDTEGILQELSEIGVIDGMVGDMDVVDVNMHI